MRKILVPSLLAMTLLTSSCSAHMSPLSSNDSTTNAEDGPTKAARIRLESLNSASKAASSVSTMPTLALSAALEKGQELKKQYSVANIKATKITKESVLERLQLIPEFASKKEIVEKALEWIDEHPKIVEKLNTMDLSLSYQNEKELCDSLKYIQDNIPVERTSREQHGIDARIAEFREIAARKPILQPRTSDRSTQTYYTWIPGLPSGGSSNASIDNYINTMAIACLPAAWFPKVTQNAYNECSMAAWGFAYGSWYLLSDSASYNYYIAMKNKYWQPSWLAEIQYSFGVTPSDLHGWIKNEGGFFSYATLTTSNSMTEMHRQIEWYNCPIIPMANGDWVTDGGHYAVPAGFDFDNIVVSDSVDSTKMAYMPVSHFVASWEAGAIRNGIRAFALANLLIFNPFAFFQYWSISDQFEYTIINPTSY